MINKEQKNRNLVLLILSLIAGLMYLTPLLRFSFYDQMMEALNLTDIQIGTIGSVYAIFCIICYPISGILADKFSTKKLLIISTFAMSLITVWYCFLPLLSHGLALSPPRARWHFPRFQIMSES